MDARENVCVLQEQKGNFYTSASLSSLRQVLNDLEIDFQRLTIKQIQLGGGGDRLAYFPLCQTKARQHRRASPSRSKHCV